MPEVTIRLEGREFIHAEVETISLKRSLLYAIGDFWLKGVVRKFYSLIL
jgi:hypothetical protein